MFSSIEEKGYTDTLICPEGYELNRIVATTYSLEPELIYLLACMFDYDSNEYINSDLSIAKTLASFGFEANVTNIIEQKKLLVFYQQDKFLCKLNLSKDKKFTALLRECCRPVKKEKYAFHPKIILAEYININDKEQMIHRLVVSSRNLTTSDFFETQVVLQKESASKISKIYNDLTLENLIEYINSKDNEWACISNSEVPQKVKVVFQSPGENEKYNLATNIFKDASSEKIVLSPFYSGVKNKSLKNIENAQFYTGDKLHSKIFCVTTNDKSTLWIGSANCTVNGLYNNYECMVGLEFNRNIQKEIKEWLEKCNFRCEKEPTEVESSEEEFIETIVRKYTFKCDAELDQNGKYVVKILVDGSDLVALEECSIGLLGLGRNKKIKKNGITFEGVEKHQITNDLLVKDKENNSRVVLAEVTDEYRQLLCQVTSELAQEKIDQLIPDFVLGSGNIGDNDDYDDSTNLSQKELMSFSPSDEEYEKIMKLYAYNRLDLLKKIKEKLEHNKKLYCSEKYEIVEQMLIALTREGM